MKTNIWNKIDQLLILYCWFCLNIFLGESFETSHHYIERCFLYTFASHSRVYVCRRSECIAGTIARFPKNGRSTQSERASRTTKFDKTGRLILLNVVLQHQIFITIILLPLTSVWAWFWSDESVECRIMQNAECNCGVECSSSCTIGSGIKIKKKKWKKWGKN